MFNISVSRESEQSHLMVQKTESYAQVACPQKSSEVSLVCTVLVQYFSRRIMPHHEYLAGPRHSPGYVAFVGCSLATPGALE